MTFKSPELYSYAFTSLWHTHIENQSETAKLKDEERKKNSKQFLAFAFFSDKKKKISTTSFVRGK